ncbi:hypothetical protein ACWD4V_32205 [Streptomyces tsukubensis]|uniref:hypothetical protein n=1 Tax=Streptomyces tsukubensis TaxID=83656 RepID=UPI0036AA54A7
MRASRALAVAAAACVAVGVPAPLAVAGGGGGDGRDNRDTGPFAISVHPRSVHEGGTLTVTVRGCSRGGTVTSNAFPTARLEHRGNAEFREGTDSRDSREGREGREGRENNDSRGDGENRGGDSRGGDNRESRDNRDNRDNRGDVQTAFARVFDRAAPGEYNLAVRCTGGSRVETAEFAVLRGRGARGGLGGSMGPTTAEMAVGGSLVAAAALGGALVITRRRRASGETA